MQAINIVGKTYPATAYTTTPENTCKGIIHGIAEDDTPETIWDSLQYNTDAPVLQFRRLGKSGPLLLLYESQRVPLWVRSDSPLPPLQEEGRGLGHLPHARRQKMLHLRHHRLRQLEPRVHHPPPPPPHCAICASPPWTLRRAAAAPSDPEIDQQAPARSSRAPAPTPDPDHVLVPEEEAGAPADATRKSSTSATSKQGIDIVSGAVKKRPSGLRKNTRKPPPYRMEFSLEGKTLPTKDDIRILEMTFQPNGHNTEQIRRLELATQQTSRLIRRIANRHSGMGGSGAALHKQYGQLEGVVYTDTADYPHQKDMTMVATDGHGVHLSGGSIPTTILETAEEVAIAIALPVPNTQTIMSDSKRAILNFARGRVSEATLRVLTRNSKIPNDMVSLIWALAHTSLPGNEADHTTARELACRARGAMVGTGNEPKKICDWAEEAAAVWGLLPSPSPASSNHTAISGLPHKQRRNSEIASQIASYCSLHCGSSNTCGFWAPTPDQPATADAILRTPSASQSRTRYVRSTASAGARSPSAIEHRRRRLI
ncbi:hypothetical protein HPB47_002045 [Ixodes persulcatus]|uniref:Uncharacterized protein n=1 Tax=Ixodes persulcatus TaxID=34615 RepID=A0AC60PN95_IXOPE|nr:hypothetical protein HPB47_002045 [Ixodes persulcatus]